MTTFWKSQARKWCDYCKCWLADNKPSIDFHENGKRHKEAVRERIKESRQRGREEKDQQRELSQMMAQIEKDAAVAMQRDLEANPSAASAYRQCQPVQAASRTGDMQGPRPERMDAQNYFDSVASRRRERELPVSAAPPPPPPPAAAEQSALPDDVWAELETDEGVVYFYNTRTGVSSWTRPESQAPADADVAPVTTNAEEPKEATAEAEVTDGGWFNDDAKTEPDSSTAATVETQAAEHGRPDRSGARIAGQPLAGSKTSSGGTEGDGALGAAEAKVGGWGVVERSAIQPAASTAKKAEVDTIVGVDGEEAAVTFAPKATPSLKRTGGSVGPIKMKKRKGNANMRGRIKKPG